VAPSGGCPRAAFGAVHLAALIRRVSETVIRRTRWEVSMHPMISQLMAAETADERVRAAKKGKSR
jgi:hypothetical protein